MHTVMTKLAQSDKVRIFVIFLVAISVMDLKPVLASSLTPTGNAPVAVYSSDPLSLGLIVFGRIRGNASLPHKMLGAFLKIGNGRAFPAAEDAFQNPRRSALNDLSAIGAGHLLQQPRADTGSYWISVLKSSLTGARAEGIGVFNDLRILPSKCISTLAARRLTHISLCFHHAQEVNRKYGTTA